LLVIVVLGALAFLPLVMPAELVARETMAVAFDEASPRAPVGAGAFDLKTLADNGYRVEAWLEFGAQALPVAVRRLSQRGTSWARAQVEDGASVVVLDVAGPTQFSAEIKHGSARTGARMATVAITF
jgi:hypothetical protein